MVIDSEAIDSLTKAINRLADVISSSGNFNGTVEKEEKIKDTRKFGEAFFAWRYGDANGDTMTHNAIANFVGVHRTTVSGWATEEFKPRIANGETPEDYLSKHGYNDPWERHVAKKILKEAGVNRFGRKTTTAEVEPIDPTSSLDPEAQKLLAETSDSEEDKVVDRESNNILDEILKINTGKES